MKVFVGGEHLIKITIHNFEKKTVRRHSKTVTELPREVEISIYTVSQKKLGHFFTAYNFRNIEQSLPNLAQIKVSSF